jgi:mannonate dehydratase
MDRRRFLELTTIPALLGGCHFSMEQGLLSACRDPSTNNISSHPTVRAAWEGLRADRVWDVHVHLFGNGRADKGVWIDPHFDEGYSPPSRVRRKFFMNAACADGDDAQVDRAMVARLASCVDQMPAGAKAMLLAFDFTYDEKGKRREDQTTFSVSNEYAQRVARSRPERFEWIASIHPYRDDAIDALARAKAGGARAVKWLPPTMAIDLANSRCTAFYDALAKWDMPLLVHVGEEQAVHGAGRADLATPLALRYPLDRGVRVIAAHCASLGKSPDADSRSGKVVSNFSLFQRLMSHQPYDGRLFGDISAVTQANRAGVLPALLAQRAWDGRLLNGSDYPLPGILPLFSLKGMVDQGVLDEKLVPVLRELRETNALLFDFVLKRHLGHGGRRFPVATFETRDFFFASSRAPSGSDPGSRP